MCFCLAGARLLSAEAGEKLGENEVLAIGTAAIKSENMALAKKNAISGALMKGVENYLVRRLGSQGVVNNFQRLLQDIIPKAKEEIENFHILTEEQIGGRYNVLVRLRINEKVIDEKLREAGLVLAEGLPIKVLFMVSEINEREIRYWWKDPESNSALSSTELALYSVFQERGFNPINRALSIPEIEYSADLRSFELQDADILEWGRLFSADVVIYGQAEIIDEEKVSLWLKALNVLYGIQISQGYQVEPIEEGLEGPKPISETLERVVKFLAARISPAIIRFAASDYEKVQYLQITLKGLSAYKQLRAFRDFLRRDVSGVKSVRQTRVKKNSISILVEFQGDRNRFLNRVLNHEDLPLSLNLDQAEEGEDIVLRTE